MKEGDLLIINAGEPHDVACGDGTAEYYVIKFLPKLLYSQGQSLTVVRHLLPMWQKQVAFHPALRKRDLEGSGIHEQVLGIKNEWETRSSGYELIAHANIMRIFVWMLRHCCSGISQQTDVPVHLQSSLQIALEETPKHLDTWNAEEAAKACGLSYNYFCHNFKRAFGFSYTSYLESLRLREGERLLLTTDMDITDIAFSVGFGTVSYFIERFRHGYGVTPRVFRERLRT
jgi:AraC-like DNA-binding protein